MKWFVIVVGELSNVVYYFFIFVNVYEVNKNIVNGLIGEGERFIW